MLSKTLDYSYHIEQITTISPKIFNGLTILFVVDGCLDVTTPIQTTHLKKGDIFIISPNESCQLTGSKTNIIFFLQLHTTYLLRYLPDFLSYTFDPYQATLGQGRKKVRQMLQKNLAELGLMCDELNQENPYQKLIEENTILQVLQILERFFKFPKSSSETQPITNNRIQAILTSVEAHYTEKISLRELAQKEFISASYLSRIFKKQLGISFTQYLQEIRLKHAVDDLIHTNQSIEQIAINNGFADVKSFRELTKQFYGLTPAAYRKKHQLSSAQENKREITQTLEKLEISNIVSALSFYSKQAISEDILQETDSEKILISPQSQPAILPKSAKLLKIGKISELLKKNIQEMIQQTNQAIAFDYLVIQDFLLDAIILPEIKTDEHISTYLRYSDLDACLKFIQEINKPLFIIISPWKEEELEKNREKLQLLFRHIQFHFDEEFCKNWKLVYDYSREKKKNCTSIWEQQIKQLKEWCEPFHLGLSFGMFVETSELTKEFANHSSYALFLEKNASLVDFYTCNIEPNQQLQESLLHQKYIQTDHAVKELEDAQKLLQSERIAKSFYIMHWNTLTGNTRLTNGIFFRGALILKTSMTLDALADGTGVWLNTELFHKYDPFHQLIDGLELFNYEKLKRPAFFALAFKNRLQGTILAKNEHYLLTQTKTGYQLLLLNPSYLNPLLSLEDWLVAKQRKEFFLTIQEMIEEGIYQIKKFTFDYQNGAVYKQMSELSTRNGTDQEIIQYIQKTTQPKLEVFDECIEKNWCFYTNLDINAVQLFELKKMDGSCSNKG